MNIPPPDDPAHHDGRLMHDLAAVNSKITRHIFNFLDADAKRAERISIAEEQALADELRAVAARLQARVDRRIALGERETIQPSAHEPPQQPPMTFTSSDSSGDT